MYKIKFLITGHVFELPAHEAEELKEKYPEDYKILEKNGKKYNDRVKKKIVRDKSILSLVKDDVI